MGPSILDHMASRPLPSYLINKHPCNGVPRAKAHPRQSIGLPIAVLGPGELDGGGDRPRAVFPDRGRAVGNQSTVVYVPLQPV